MMDRKILLLMLALIPVSQAQDLIVSQPSSAQGTEGGSVTLRCFYNSSSEPKVGSYSWLKDSGLVVRNTSQGFMGRVNCTSDQGFLLAKRADIEIRDLRFNDSGMYHCMVNIHGLQETSGKGTELQVIKRAPGAQSLVVSQPSSAEGTEGGSVTLRCSYNSTSKPKVGSYQWVKEPGLLVKKTSPEFAGRVNGTSDQHFLLDQRADLEIRDLRLNDSGMYRCVVNIHSLQETLGYGTELQVRERGALSDPPTPGSVPYPILGAGVASGFVVSIVGCLLFLYCRRTQGCQAAVSRTQCPQQDSKAEAGLNYTELIVKAEQNFTLQREVVTYLAVGAHDG